MIAEKINAAAPDNSPELPDCVDLQGFVCFNEYERP